ncbi:hypothetical protein C8F01DRAFT_1370446 [Mycena amicta]|nr:hypothetical protein C8F01DRAFT_1370446 [Mycena amicta]
MVAEDPRLPPELERKIFEITARVHPEMRHRLLFVARRVLIWIEPTLYRTLVFTPHHRLSQLPAKSSEFFAKTTRRLTVGTTASDDAARVLELCTGVTHLALGGHVDVPDLLYAPFRALQQIRRLAFYPSNVLLAAGDATLPVFSSLTHLQLFDYNDDILGSFCAALPALTHLAVTGDLSDPWPRADIVLADCKKLTLLVLLSSNPQSAKAKVPEDLADPRVVVTWFKTWNESALEGYNFWAAASDFAARKRQGLIKESCFFAERGRGYGR